MYLRCAGCSVVHKVLDRGSSILWKGCMAVQTLTVNDELERSLCALNMAPSQLKSVFCESGYSDKAARFLSRSLERVQSTWGAFTVSLQRCRQRTNTLLTHVNSLPEHMLHWQLYNFHAGNSPQDSREIVDTQPTGPPLHQSLTATYSSSTRLQTLVVEATTLTSGARLYNTLASSR